MPIQSAEKTIDAWKSAYREANSKAHAPYVSYGSGWFRIKGRMSAVREKDMIDMTRTLNLRIAQREGQADAAGT